jgi:hypothetical protein
MSENPSQPLIELREVPMLRAHEVEFLNGSTAALTDLIKQYRTISDAVLPHLQTLHDVLREIKIRIEDAQARERITRKDQISPQLP